MNFYALSGLINALAATSLGLLVYFKNRKGKANQGFGLFSLSVSAWSWSYFIWQISGNYSSALFWSRALMAGAIFVPVSYLHFVLALVGQLKRKKKFLILSYFLFSIFLIFNFTPLFVKNVEPELSFPFWPKPGIIFHPFLAVWFAYFIYSFYLLLLNYKKSFGIKRDQIKYSLLGLLGALAGASTNYCLWYGIQIPPIGNIAVILYIGATAYAIATRELFNIKVILTDLLVGIMGIILLVLIFLMPTNALRILIGTVFILFCFFGYYLIKAVHEEEKRRQEAEKLAQKEAERRGEAERFKNTSLKLKERISQILDLEEVVPRIIDVLVEVFKTDKISFALKQPTSEFYQFHKTIGFTEKELASLIKDTPLCFYLETARKPLIKEGFKDIQGVLERNKIEALLPLFQKQQLIGIIFLGEKSAGTSYSKEDIDLLEALSYQISISFNSALLYEEIKKDKEALEKFYRLTVGREVRMAELKKKIKELEEKLKGEEDGT